MKIFGELKPNDEFYVYDIGCRELLKKRVKSVSLCGDRCEIYFEQRLPHTFQFSIELYRDDCFDDMILENVIMMLSPSMEGIIAALDKMREGLLEHIESLTK